MLFLVAGILKDGVEDRLLALRDEWNEHIAQPGMPIRLFGALRNKDGHRTGYLAIVRFDAFEEADTYLRRSPFYQNKLYERVEVAEFNLEVGSIGE